MTERAILEIIVGVKCVEMLIEMLNYTCTCYACSTSIFSPSITYYTMHNNVQVHVYYPIAYIHVRTLLVLSIIIKNVFLFLHRFFYFLINLIVFNCF